MRYELILLKDGAIILKYIRSHSYPLLTGSRSKSWFYRFRTFFNGETYENVSKISLIFEINSELKNTGYFVFNLYLIISKRLSILLLKWQCVYFFISKPEKAVYSLHVFYEHMPSPQSKMLK